MNIETTEHHLNDNISSTLSSREEQGLRSGEWHFYVLYLIMSSQQDVSLDFHAWSLSKIDH